MAKICLKSITLPSRLDEDSFLFFDAKQNMSCYDGTLFYPFGLFPPKGLTELNFERITILYGGNGSGKSTLLNLLADKLKLKRAALCNRTHYFEDYLQMCRCTCTGNGSLPEGSCIITSDDVFDFLLDHRALNEGVNNRREELFDEWMQTAYQGTYGDPFRLCSLEDYDELKRHNQARHTTRSAYTDQRLPVREMRGQSNGESAFGYFTKRIKDGTTCLLDEPENSLSAELQQKLAQYLSDSARFYNVQLVIATHSPFMLAIPGAHIYDLDSCPVCERAWTDLPNVRVWYDFFTKHRNEFEKQTFTEERRKKT